MAHFHFFPQVLLTEIIAIVYILYRSHRSHAEFNGCAANWIGAPAPAVAKRRKSCSMTHGAEFRAKRRCEEPVSITVEDYHKNYGETVAVSGISFTVPPGEI